MARLPLFGIVTGFLLLVLAAPGAADEDGWTVISGPKALEAFRGPTGDWMIAESVMLDPDNSRRLKAKEGKDILVNSPKGKAPDLITKQEYRDLEVHVEFLIAKGSNSGVKMMGLYEVQIYDSYGKKEPTGADCGGIYPRAEDKPKYRHIDNGVPPKVNACKPAGEWQTLDITFVAPRFNNEGKKTANARFVKVVLNGQVVHENVEVEYPTGSNWRLRKEIAVGPLLLQGDHGPVAFRNLRLRPTPEKKDKP